MSATEREHVMPPRPLMPWTMALCAGMCMSCALVLNVAADALLREQAPAVGLLWAIPVAAAVFVVLAQSCARLAPWKRWLYAASVGLVGSEMCIRDRRLEGARRSSGKQPRVCRAG